MLVLSTREKTHGSYLSTAKIAQSIKDAMRGSPNWIRLTDVQAESLEMIAVKLARILCGDPDFQDHWQDVMGYAKLAMPTEPETDTQMALDLINALNNGIR